MRCRPLPALLLSACCAAPALPAAAQAPTATAQPAVAGPAAGPVAPATAPAARARPRIGLVLGGGGARGAAHIGVLEVLERLRVPVDCVAGTSMGALVAGAWAAGLTPQAMREALARADWADLFIDDPDYAELNFRAKRLSQRFLAGTESGVQAGGLVAPPGVIGGQKLKLFFNQLVRADIAGDREIAKLPLPLSLVATDIATGQRFVFRDGPLTTAMRASMSVPGLLAPLTVDGRKLVDGGLVDNVPIGEVRERCGAEVVIAVNVGSPLLKPEEITGLLSVSAQMVAILTEQNVRASLASLQPGDLLLQPDLGDITAGSFERHADAADRGRAAAESMAPALARLAADEAAYATWQARIRPADAQPKPIDAIEVAGLSRVNPATLRRWLGQTAGVPLDTQRLERDLLRVYGDGWYQSVDYAIVDENGRRVLRVLPVEKAWGPDYLRFGLNLESNLSQGSSYALRAAWQKTWLNAWGADAVASVEFGSRTGADLTLHQPLGPSQRFYGEASIGWHRERADLFLGRDRIAAYRVGTSTIDLALGANVGLLGQVQLGWRELRRRPRLDTGLPILPETALEAHGVLATLDFDQQNRLYFPTRGWAARGSWFAPEDRGYQRLELEGRWAVSYRDWVLATRATWTGSPRGQLPAFDAATLGGFLNLSGFAAGQLWGDSTRYVHLRGERIVGRLPLGLRGDMRFGVALEAGALGRPFAPPPGRIGKGWLDSLTVYLGGETPLGPVFVGVARASAGSTNAYLFIGTP